MWMTSFTYFGQVNVDEDSSDPGSSVESIEIQICSGKNKHQQSPAKHTNSTIGPLERNILMHSMRLFNSWYNYLLHISIHNLGMQFNTTIKQVQFRLVNSLQGVILGLREVFSLVHQESTQGQWAQVQHLNDGSEILVDVNAQCRPNKGGDNNKGSQWDKVVLGAIGGIGRYVAIGCCRSFEYFCSRNFKREEGPNIESEDDFPGEEWSKGQQGKDAEAQLRVGDHHQNLKISPLISTTTKLLDLKLTWVMKVKITKKAGGTIRYRMVSYSGSSAVILMSNPKQMFWLLLLLLLKLVHNWQRLTSR